MRGIKKGHKWSREVLIKRGIAISKAKKGNTFFSEETRKKIGLKSKGHKLSLEAKQKIREKLMGNHNSKGTKKGKFASNWKGGLTKKSEIIRSSTEYKLWREAVFKRDNHTCIWCGSKEKIQADHIKKFADYPELRFAIDNGRTLCEPCHKTTETYGNKGRKILCP